MTGFSEIELLLLFLFWIGEAILAAAAVNIRSGEWFAAFLVTLFWSNRIPDSYGDGPTL